MNKREFIINGGHFNNFGEFFDEIEKVFMKKLKRRIGRNLNALSDVLSGGFGMFEYGEQIEIVWMNSEKSKRDFGYSQMADFQKKSIISAILNSRIRNAFELAVLAKKARKNEGPTLFETIIETITGCDNVNLILK